MRLGEKTLIVRNTQINRFIIFSRMMKGNQKLAMAMAKRKNVTHQMINLIDGQLLPTSFL